jgi:hypothetical protein
MDNIFLFYETSYLSKEVNCTEPSPHAVFPDTILYGLLLLLASFTGNIALQNGTERFKKVNNCLNTNIYSYLETPNGQSSNLYLFVVHFFNTSVY